jgi:hypothetical protein
MDLALIILGSVFVCLAFFAGKLIGQLKQQDLWQEHMDKTNKYVHAIEDIQKWCGDSSPHARAIVKHITLTVEEKTPLIAASDVLILRDELLKLDMLAKSGNKETSGVRYFAQLK